MGKDNRVIRELQARARSEGRKRVEMLAEDVRGGLWEGRSKAIWGFGRDLEDCEMPSEQSIQQSKHK